MIDNKGKKVSFIIVDESELVLDDNQRDEHFQFVQNLAKNFDKQKSIKTDYKRSSSGAAISKSSCCSSSTKRFFNVNTGHRSDSSMGKPG